MFKKIFSAYLFVFYMLVPSLLKTTIELPPARSIPIHPELFIPAYVRSIFFPKPEDTYHLFHEALINNLGILKFTEQANFSIALYGNTQKVYVQNTIHAYGQKSQNIINVKGFVADVVEEKIEHTELQLNAENIAEMDHFLQYFLDFTHAFCQAHKRCNFEINIRPIPAQSQATIAKQVHSELEQELDNLAQAFVQLLSKKKLRSFHIQLSANTAAHKITVNYRVQTNDNQQLIIEGKKTKTQTLIFANSRAIKPKTSKVTFCLDLDQNNQLVSSEQWHHFSDRFSQNILDLLPLDNLAIEIEKSWHYST